MSNHQIMIVEDEEITSADIQMSVEKMGYAICATASTGLEAIDKAGATRPDLILMDIILKGSMDGIEAATRIKELYQIPVIYLTAFGDDAVLQRAKVTEPYGYLTKPFADRDLHIAIEISINKKKAEARIEERIAAELLRAESKFRKSERQYKCLVENVPGIIYTYSTERSGIYYSPQVKAVLGYTDEHLLNHPTLWHDSIHPDDLPAVNQVIKNVLPGQNVAIEYRIRDAYGQEHWLHDRSVSIVNEAGERIITGIATEITELKQAEEDRERSLKEKTVMLQEIHHRVKNNLTVIYSLLNLQAEGITDASVRVKFEESRNRILSMALIHEKLYGSQDFAHVDFKEYLQSLVSRIAETYNRQDVIVSVDMEHVALDINVGIPCGLIVNELVSNCLKYAFPKGRTGTVRVGISMNNEGSHILFVEDDGVGFPADIDFQNTSSLGLQLIIGLTNQIRGTIELSREGGTSFRITFRCTPESREQQNG